MIGFGLLACLAALLLLLAAGCKTTSFEQTLPGGATIRASDTRFLVGTKARIHGAVNPTNGLVEITVEADSTPETKLVSDVIGAAIQAAVKP